MKINTSYVQKCKVAAHAFQALFIFIAACITIAVLTKGGETGGGTKFFFALCFFTAPALIYLVMVPMWSRAQRFANAYAFVALDALYTLLWFAAIIAVALWNSKGTRDGAAEAKAPERNCTTFKYGSETKCKLSRATVGFGVMIFIFFVLTTAISAYYLHKFLKEGIMPYESHKSVNPHGASGDLSKDPAWSTEIEHHSAHNDDDDDDDRHTEHGGNQHEDEYALLHSTETDEGRHPGRPLSWGEDRRARAAGGYAGAGVDAELGAVQPPYAAYHENDSALSPGGYEQYRSNAGHGGKGYSFSGGER